MWLNIKGYEGEYQISKKGIIRRLSEGGDAYIVKHHTALNGKWYVTLWKNGNRKNYMLHNLYADTFGIPVKNAIRILYEGYKGDAIAKENVRNWLLSKIYDCEQQNLDYSNDEILYLKSFLKQLE